MNIAVGIIDARTLKYDAAVVRLFQIFVNSLIYGCVMFGVESWAWFEVLYEEPNSKTAYGHSKVTNFNTKFTTNEKC